MKKSKSGVSLIEILVVITVFAVLGILATRAILLSLVGSRKGDAQIKVRENVDYAVSVMERQLRNAESVSPCLEIPEPVSVINYNDSDNNPSSFTCNIIEGYIASGSARLTSDEIEITSCTFTCTEGTASTPPKVAIDIKAQDAGTQGSKEGSSVTVATEINLRTY